MGINYLVFVNYNKRGAFPVEIHEEFENVINKVNGLKTSFLWRRNDKKNHFISIGLIQ